MIRRPRRSTLFPYTPLSRSAELLPRHLEPRHAARAVAAGVDAADRAADDGIGHDAALLEELERAHVVRAEGRDRKSTRLNSSHGYISYAVFCLKKKNKITHH